MQILQRFPWPPKVADEVLLKMYFLLNRPTVWNSISGLSALCPTDVISFSTYFGAFSLTTWCDSAGIDKVVIRIKASGGAMIRIIHIKPDESREILAETVLSNDLPPDEKWTEIALGNLSGKQGILFPEITVLEEGTRFAGLEYATPQPPRYLVRMALIMTTFKRETYVKKNMEKILTILPEYDGRINFIIVDNGKSLNTDPVPPEVTVLPNGNFGGSGGFGRGLLEALDDPKKFTHFLFVMMTLNLKQKQFGEPIPSGNISMARPPLWEELCSAWKKRHYLCCRRILRSKSNLHPLFQTRSRNIAKESC